MHAAGLRLGVLLALVLGTGATGWGLSVHGGSLLTPIWTPHHWAQAQWVLAIGGLVFAAGVVARRPAATGALLAVAAAAAFGVAALVAAGLLFLVAFLLGWAALKAFEPGGEPDPLTALSSGIALLLLVLPALGVADVEMRPVFFGALVGALCVLFVPSSRAALADLVRRLLAVPVPAARRWLPLSLMTAWFVFALAHASLPARLWDVFAMHLMVPNQIVTFGRWSHSPAELAFAVFPMGANYLFAFAMELGGEAAAQLANLFLVIGILALTRDILRAFCGPAMQDIGLLMLLGTPLVLALSVIPLVENTLAFLVVAAVRTLLRWDGAASRQAILSLLLVLPALAAVKLHGAVVAAVIFPIALWRIRATRAWLGRWALLLGIAAASGALGLVQYLHAWHLTGNPFFPFMNQIFLSPLWPPTALEDLRWTGRFAPDLLYEMTFRSPNFLEAYPGAIGFCGLALLLAGAVATLLFPQRAPLLCLVIALPPVLFVLTQIQYLRYLHFAMPLLVVVKLYGLVQFAQLPYARVPAAVLGFALGAGGFLVLPAASWTLVAADLRGAYDPVVRHQVAMQVPERLANEMVNAMAIGRPRVIYGSAPYGANLRGWPIYTQWYNFPLMMALHRSEDPAELDATLARLRGDFIIARFPAAGAQEAKLVDFAERNGRVVGEVGPVRIWRLAP